MKEVGKWWGNMMYDLWKFLSFLIVVFILEGVSVYDVFGCVYFVYKFMCIM